MSTTDDQLDAKSKRLLDRIDDMRRLEHQKRQAARSTDEFHELAEKVDRAASGVYRMAHEQLEEGEEDSPISAEREEQHAGDWTEGSRN